MDTIPAPLFPDIPVSSESPGPEPETADETAAIGDPPGQLTLQFAEAGPTEK